MNKQEILDAVSSLAKSQGFYGRLLLELNEKEEMLNYLVDQNFKDVVDMVMFLEG